MAIVDQEGILIAILVGYPRDKSWQNLNAEAANALEKARIQTHMKKQKNSRRGILFFPSDPAFYMGGGQTTPINMNFKSSWNKKIVTELNDMECFKRINGFTNSKSPPVVSFFHNSMAPQAF